MKLEEFLRTVLPPQGDYFLSHLPTTGGELKQRKADNIGQLTTRINAHIQARKDVFFATGAYDGRRLKTAVKGKKVLYVDIDCKEAGQYENKGDAVKAIKAALHDGLLPPTIIVDSGNGYHLYWVLSESIAGNLWQPLASALVKACTKHKLNIDKGITSDSARIMRVPGSVNYKDPNNPKPCEIKSLNDERRYTYDELREALQPYAELTPEEVSTALPNNVVQMIPELAKVSTVGEHDLGAGLNMREAKADIMVDLCPLFKEALDTGGKNHVGEIWHKLIQVLTFAEGGYDYLHKISDQHPEYTERKTEKKWQEATDARERNPDLGPTRCQVFAQHSVKCAQCQWRQSAGTPLMLGKKRPDDLPYGYRLGEHGTEMLDDEEWVQIIRYHVEGLRMQQVVEGQPTLIQLKIDGTTINTDLGHFTEGRSIAGVLSGYSIKLNSPELEQFGRLMSAWIKQLRQARRISYDSKRLGWTEDNGFSYGGNIYRAKDTLGTIQNDPVMSKIYSPHGDLEVWKKCANHILAQPRPAVWCGVASAFAGPLVPFTGTRGLILTLISAESGTGKSTVMRTAQAVWGRPNMAMSSLDDTANSISNKMGQLNNLPGYWDEVRERKAVTDLVKTLFRLTQGKDRSRLNANAQQRVVEEWSTMLVIASNDALRDHVEAQLGNSDAGAARILELQVPPIPDDGLSEASARHLFADLDKHFGGAGAVYAAYLGANYKKVHALTQDTDNKLSAALKANKNERFWVATMATLLVGARIANHLGLCQFDIAAMQQYLIQQFRLARLVIADINSATGQNPSGVVQQFLHHYIDHTITSQHLPSPGKARESVASPTKMPVEVRVAVADSVIRINKATFKSWYYDRYGAGATAILKTLEGMGVTTPRGRIDAGVFGGNGGQVACLDIPLAAKDFADLYDLEAAKGQIDNSDLG